jgi:hypothetical protein
MIFSRARYPFTVTVYLDGRHPYLEGNELDYPSRNARLLVQARNWNDAERQAWVEARKYMPWWSCRVRGIERGDTRP